ncbi:MAG: DNA polymerase III subunit alpha [Nevskiales bacterium]
MTSAFVHLRVHSEYSLVDGLVRLPELVAQTRALGMPACAVTDQGNLFALVKFYKEAVSTGLKPVIGVDLLLADPKGAAAPSRLTLLCQNQTGYRHLTQLVSRSFLEGQRRGAPMIEREWLQGHTEGLIALSGAHEGEVGRLLLAGKSEPAAALAREWQNWFPGRFYLEVQRCGRPEDEPHLAAAVQLALAQTLPLVATNDVRFLKTEEFAAHEVRVCIHEGFVLNDPRRPRRYSPQQYLKSPVEMAALFADLPEALANSVHIAARCNLELALGQNFLPDFPVPESHSAVTWLQQQAEQGLTQRLQELATRQPKRPPDQAQYTQRLRTELEVISKMGFAGYFLIVADFIHWAREHSVPVGPGRGSGAGSLVAYSLGITDLDPLSYELLFERFLNPERVSMPDFDIDFCMEGRDRVIDYVAARYGQKRVSQIITYGSLAARAVVRDVGRVLGHPYGMVDKIAKLIPGGPQNLDITLDDALGLSAKSEDKPQMVSAELRAAYEREEEVRYMIDTARTLEGLVRNAGKHAGGVVIAPSDLTEFTPLYCEAGGQHPVTQLDKDDVEAVGLVKFDFLGLRTLTIIDRAVRLINQRRSESTPLLDIRNLPLDDSKTYALYASGKTAAVFQMESGGMQRASVGLKPDRFEDIIALISLFRPGPMELIPEYVERKHGRKRVEYLHAKLEPILRPTYGIIVYQEQVMQIAQELAGYTLGGADLLRRAMGKKKADEMAKQRTIFITGAGEQNVDAHQAGLIFDLMEKFASYGFNKSHAAAYALLSYQTAWLKAHHPAAFMCAVLSADMAHTDKVVTMIAECNRLGLKVLPPDINHSLYDFGVVDDASVRYGLGAIKGVGEAAIEAIAGERAAHGPFRDLFDFCQRVDLRKVNKRVLEALLYAGALDPLGPNRASLLGAMDEAVRAAERRESAVSAGQSDMFGLGAGAKAAERPTFELKLLPEWPDARRLQAEKDTLGLYLTGHPIEAFREELMQFTSGSLLELAGEGGGAAPAQVLLAGFVVDLRRFGNRTLVTLDDRSARLECVMFESASQAYARLLQADALVLMQGRLGFDDYAGAYRLTVQEVMDLEEARRRYARRVLISVETLDVVALESCLARHRQASGAWVSVRYRNARSRGLLHLGEAWRVLASDKLLIELRALVGEAAVELRYQRPSAAPASAAA